jgi:membrane associated rhomboid family serine protease
LCACHVYRQWCSYFEGLKKLNIKKKISSKLEMIRCCSLVAVLYVLFLCQCFMGGNNFNCGSGGSGSVFFLVGVQADDHNNNVRLKQQQTSRNIRFKSSPVIRFHRGGENSYDEHNAWLQQQQHQQQLSPSNQYQQFQSTTTTTPQTKIGRKRRRWNDNGILPSFVSTKSLTMASQSNFGTARIYCERLYHDCPTAFWTTSTSIVVFLFWQLLPSFARPMLLQFFLASRQTVIRSYGLSLVLSTISHTSFRHLLVNMFVFLNLSPAISALLVSSSSLSRRTRLSSSAMWPLLLGGGVFGNLLFLLFRPAGSCLGLSGVTMAMLGVYASDAPDRMLRIMLGGIIPVSIKAGTLVQFLLVFSLAGSLFLPSSPIAHLAHLGGLIFGLLYYQNVIIAGGSNNIKKIFATKKLFGR